MGESNVLPIMNLANSIVGVSILAMPYCFSQCGILLGTILLVLCTFFTAWSCKMLMRAAIMTHNHTYENLSLGIYGSLGKYTTGISIIGLNLGTCVAFFVIIGDLAPPIIAQALGITWSPYTLRAFVLIAAAVLIAFPLGLLRSITSLSGISMCSLLFYAVLTLQLCSLALPSLRSWGWWHRVTWWDNNGLLKCIPIFALAFACQTQLFVIYGALKDPTFRRVSAVINGATSAIATLYFLVAFFGVVSFTRDGVKGDVLANYDVSFISQIFRFSFSLSVVVSFPLMIFPCRVSINSLFFSSKSLELHVQEPIPRKRFILITAGIIGTTLTIAILIPNVETVLGLTGASMGCLIAFIFPALMFLKVAGSSADYSNRAKVLACVGVCVMVLSTTVILQTEMSREHEVGAPYVNRRPHPEPPPDLIPPPHVHPPVIPQPVKPDQPAKPDVPTIPAKPDIPEEIVKPVVPGTKKPDEPVQVEEPDHLNRPKEPDKQEQVKNSPGNNTKGVAGGGEGMAGGGVAVSEPVKDMKALQQGMSQLQSRLNHLEEENKNLKERQKVLEEIQVDEILKQPGVLDHKPGGEEEGVAKPEGGAGGVGGQQENNPPADSIHKDGAAQRSLQGGGVEVPGPQHHEGVNPQHQGGMDDVPNPQHQGGGEEVAPFRQDKLQEETKGNIAAGLGGGVEKGKKEPIQKLPPGPEAAVGPEAPVGEQPKDAGHHLAERELVEPTKQVQLAHPGVGGGGNQSAVQGGSKRDLKQYSLSTA